MTPVERTAQLLRETADAYEALPAVFKESMFVGLRVNPAGMRAEADRIEARQAQFVSATTEIASRQGS